MEVETPEQFEKMKSDVQDLINTWMNEIIEQGNKMIAEGFDGDAHMYLLKVYASAGATLRQRLGDHARKNGGYLIDNVVKSDG